MKRDFVVLQTESELIPDFSCNMLPFAAARMDVVGDRGSIGIGNIGAVGCVLYEHFNRVVLT